MDLFEEVMRLRREGKSAVLATIVHTNGSIPSFESSRMLVREDGSIVGTIGGGCVEAEVWAAAKDVLKAEAPRKMVFNLNNEASYDNGLICGGTLEVFVEPILPQPTLYIFGGGHVSMALAQTAQHGGLCHRRDRRPRAVCQPRTLSHGRARFTRPSKTPSRRLQPNASSYLVIVTRGHRDDMRVLGWAVNTEARYIGMIGSKRKVLSVYKALEREGFAPELFERVHAPVGLDIGALTPEEIAISITAELIAVRRGATGLAHKAVERGTSSARAVRSAVQPAEVTACSPPLFSPGANPPAWVLPRRWFPSAADVSRTSARRR